MFCSVPIAPPATRFDTDRRTSSTLSAGAVLRNGMVSPSRNTAADRPILRRHQSDIDVAEGGGLAQFSAGVARELGVAGHIDVGDRRGAVELDVVEHADLHSTGVHLGPGGQVEHAGELDLDSVGVVGRVGARDRQPGRI